MKNKTVSQYFSEIRKKTLKKMTPEQRKKMMQKASKARWANKTPLEIKEFCKMMRNKKQEYAQDSKKTS